MEKKEIWFAVICAFLIGFGLGAGIATLLVYY